MKTIEEFADGIVIKSDPNSAYNIRYDFLIDSENADPSVGIQGGIFIEEIILNSIVKCDENNNEHKINIKELSKKEIEEFKKEIEKQINLNSIVADMKAESESNRYD